MNESASPTLTFNGATNDKENKSQETEREKKISKEKAGPSSIPISTGLYPATSIATRASTLRQEPHCGGKDGRPGRVVEAFVVMAVCVNGDTNNSGGTGRCGYDSTSKRKNGGVMVAVASLTFG